MSIEQIGILLTLLLTILGWSVTAYYQRQILEKQIQADKEKLAQQFAHEKEMFDLQSQQKAKELEQQGLRQLRFEILPTARDKMVETFSWASHLTRRLLTFPDLNSMTLAQLQDVVKNLEFSVSQKEELLIAHDKNDYYLEKKFWYDLDKAERCASEFYNYLVIKKLFIEPDLLTKFSSVHKILAETLNTFRISKQTRDNQMFFSAGDELASKVPDMIQEIERLIREQLR